VKIRVGDLNFPSKDRAFDYFKNMLHRYRLGDVVDDFDFQELLPLLEQHPTYEQKRGVGVTKFRIIKAPYNSRGFLIVRSDGSTTDFSYRKCIGAPAQPLRKVIAALRTEVQDDILQAKRHYFAAHSDALGRVPCALTGTLVTVDQADADHAPPYTFHVLATTFLDARKIVPSETILTPPADNQFGRTLLDRDLAAAWRDFHHRHADIRIVAKTEHRTMSQRNRARAANRQLTLRQGEGL
jgi:hypothetical protein